MKIKFILLLACLSLSSCTGAEATNQLHLCRATLVNNKNNSTNIEKEIFSQLETTLELLPIHLSDECEIRIDVFNDYVGNMRLKIVVVSNNGTDVLHSYEQTIEKHNLFYNIPDMFGRIYDDMSDYKQIKSSVKNCISENESIKLLETIKSSRSFFFASKNVGPIRQSCDILCRSIATSTGKLEIVFNLPQGRWAAYAEVYGAHVGSQKMEAIESVGMPRPILSSGWYAFRRSAHNGRHDVQATNSMSRIPQLRLVDTQIHMDGVEVTRWSIAVISESGKKVGNIDGGQIVNSFGKTDLCSFTARSSSDFLSQTILSEY